MNALSLSPCSLDATTIRAPIRRRTSVIAHKKPEEHIPISEDMYKKSSVRQVAHFRYPVWNGPN